MGGNMLEELNRKKIDKQDDTLPINIEQLIEKYNLDKTWRCLEKIENQLEELEKNLTLRGTYTKATGQYTTAQWAPGTNTCTWTAPRKGAYIIWIRFTPTEEAYGKVYKQFHLHGNTDKIMGNVMFYQHGPSNTNGDFDKSIIIYEGCTIVYANKAGDTVTPYIHSPIVGHVWNVEITGMFVG